MYRHDYGLRIIPSYNIYLMVFMPILLEKEVLI